MPLAWTFSALRPAEFSTPVPTGETLPSMWRLMAPSVRKAVAPDPQTAPAPAGSVGSACGDDDGHPEPQPTRS